MNWQRPAAWIAAVLIAGCATAPTAPSSPSGREQAVHAASVEDTAGVEVVSLRKTVAGRMLDFRFRVIDPEKAAPLLSRGTPAYLFDPATGANMPVPNTKVGNMRQTTQGPEKGRVYFIFFDAAGRHVNPGDKVTVVIGEHRFENLTVQ
jgi:hypothetical protein